MMLKKLLLIFLFIVIGNYVGFSQNIDWFIEPKITDVNRIIAENSEIKPTIFIVEKSGKFGVKNKDNTVIIPINYSRIIISRSQKYITTVEGNVAEYFDAEGYNVTKEEVEKESSITYEMIHSKSIQESIEKLKKQYPAYNIMLENNKLIFMSGIDTIYKCYKIQISEITISPKGFIKYKNSVIGPKGNTVIKKETYKSIDNEEIGYYVAHKNKDLKDLYDQDFNLVLPGLYDQIRPLVKDLFSAKKGEDWFLVDVQNNKYHPQPSDFIYKPKSSNNVYLKMKQGLGLYNLETKKLDLYEFTLLGTNEVGNNYPVIKDSLKGYFNIETRKTIVPLKYKSILHIGGGLLAGNYSTRKENRKITFMDIYTENGKLVFSDSIKYFSNINKGSILRTAQNKDIVLNNEGAIVYVLKDTIVESLSKGYFIKLKHNNKAWFISINDFLTKKMNPVSYEEIEFIDDYSTKCAIAKKNGKYGIIDMDGKEIVPFVLEGIIDAGAMPQVLYNGKMGVIKIPGNK